jgi:hypothetical protein
MECAFVTTKLSESNGCGRENRPLSVFRFSPVRYIRLSSSFFCLIPPLILYKTMQKLYKTALDITLKKMKHKDLRNIVKIKCENGDGPMKIFRDLCGAVSLTQIKWWLRLIRETGDIDLSKPQVVSVLQGQTRTSRRSRTYCAKQSEHLLEKWQKNCVYRREMFDAYYMKI